MTEQQLQRAVADYLAAVLPDGAWFTSIAHGWGRRTAGPGAKPGVPDMLVINNGQAMWLELKTPRGTVSAQQTRCCADLRYCGSPVALCRSVEDVRATLIRWGVPLRDHHLQGA